MQLGLSAAPFREGLTLDLFLNKQKALAVQPGHRIPTEPTAAGPSERLFRLIPGVEMTLLGGTGAFGLCT